MPKSTAEKRDIYQEVTDSIVKSLETAGEWSRPWVSIGNDVAAPRSIDNRPYRGVNVLLLWASALEAGYEHGIWGTYKAWEGKGAQVRKGEKATLVTLWKPFSRKANGTEVAEGRADKDGKIQSLLLRYYHVFNVAQVDGYEVPVIEGPTGPDPVEAAEAFFANVGATVLTHGDRAFYSKFDDRITVPKIEAFKSAESYYATLAHEHGHWTGHESRLDRKLGNRFGSEDYAFEELIAELSAAFTGAHLGLPSIVRDDHASYVKNWVKVLKDDKKAIFTAASKAQKATDFLLARQEAGAPKATPELEEVAA